MLNTNAELDGNRRLPIEDSFDHYHCLDYKQNAQNSIQPSSHATYRSLTTSSRLAVTVGVVDLATILSTKVVVLLGTYALGEHGASQDTWGVFRDVLLISIGIVVGVDEFAALDTVASSQTVVDIVGEGVGHVRRILGSGSDGLTLQMTVRSDDLVVDVLDLVGEITDRLIAARCGGLASPWEISELISTKADVQAESGKDRLAFDRVSAIPERLGYQ